MKFINKIIFLYFKFFSWKLIFSLSKQPFNNNIAILGNKIIFFCLRSNFCGSTTLKNTNKYIHTYKYTNLLILIYHMYIKVYEKLIRLLTVSVVMFEEVTIFSISLPALNIFLKLVHFLYSFQRDNLNTVKDSFISYFNLQYCRQL